jgi:hypothetical protein
VAVVDEGQQRDSLGRGDAGQGNQMSDQASSVVPRGASGLVLAIQFWAGDEARALRLVRLLADLEPRRRKDVTLMLSRRFDLELSQVVAEAGEYASDSFAVIHHQSRRVGDGHPAGCNQLMGDTMDRLGEMWTAGELLHSSAFLIEYDGCPLRRDWLDVLIAEHDRTLAAGKAITGPYMAFLPHINGTMVMHVPWWVDHPSVHYTPPTQGWDIFHRETMLAAAYRTKLILNLHGSRNWTNDQLRPLSMEHVWMTSVKDESVIGWAERSL